VTLADIPEHVGSAPKHRVTENEGDPCIAFRWLFYLSQFMCLIILCLSAWI